MIIHCKIRMLRNSCGKHIASSGFKEGLILYDSKINEDHLLTSVTFLEGYQGSANLPYETVVSATLHPICKIAVLG